MSRHDNACDDKHFRHDSESDAHHLPTDICNTDPALAMVVAVWPDLSEATRQTILLLVNSAIGSIDRRQGT
jgi:hypothetical protein